MNSANNGLPSRSGFLSRVVTIPAWLLGLIALLAILAAVLRIPIPDFVWVLVILLLVLIGWFSGRGTGSSKELSDPAAPGHRIRVSNFPRYSNPTLLKIQDRAELLDSDKSPEIGLVISVAGDLVFAVNRFDSPVELVMNYTDDDERLWKERQQSLAPQNVELIPIYLYTPTTDEGGSKDRFWKPFEDFTLDTERKEARIRVSAWGDSPTGWGSQP